MATGPLSFGLALAGEPLALGGWLGGMAHWLKINAWRPGRTLGVVTDHRLSVLVAALAQPEHGYRLALVDPALPAPTRARLLAQAGCHLCLDRPLEPRPGKAAPLVGEGEGSLLLATSGTTGQPRWVVLQRDQLMASATAVAGHLKLGAADRWLAVLPPHHVGGLAPLYRCLAVGATLELLPRFDATEVLRRLAHGGVTHLSLVPAMLDLLLERAPSFRPPSTLRVVLLGGAAAPASLVHRALALGWPLYPGYGLTEGASLMAGDAADHGWQEGLAGRPLPHVEVRLDGAGRIRLRGPSMARHGIGEGGEVRPLLDGEGWLTTADLGRVDDQGRLWIWGRVDDCIVSGGEKVLPAPVEAVLGRCPGIEEVAVVGVPDARWGARVVACYRGEASPGFLEAWARERLQGAHRPRAFLPLPALPRNALGKLDRRRLQAWAVRALGSRKGVKASSMAGGRGVGRPS